MRAIKSSSCSILITLLFFGLLGCDRWRTQHNDAPLASNKEALLKIDSACNLLQPGDIVFRRGSDAISDLFSRCNLQDKSFSHCGLYLLDSAGKGWIYHSIGGNENPNKRIQKDSAHVFFSPRHNNAMGIYRYPFLPQQLVRLDSFILAAVTKGYTFDMQFDLATNEQLYCTELVYKAINTALNDTIFATTTMKNQTIVCPDNVFLANGMRCVKKVKF
ncbi:MAG: hypothetical protein RL660_3070 [Bacteroidota bacterium]|jgi:hypothetical protein